MKPFISICIPAYKNAEFLEVLLKSIASQTFKDFEVVITDDSPDTQVETLCSQYSNALPLTYHKNSPAKGSPANWNVGILLAKGDWIKLMHDDDWFADENSLEQFATAAKQQPQAGFIFSGYTKYEDDKIKETSIPGNAAKDKLNHSALSLFGNNFIGHPSTTMVKNEMREWYDEQTKWVVDFEFYIRCLKQFPFYSIPHALINIGISDEQITKSTFRNREVEIPENLYLLKKMGVGILQNKTVYDHYWRMFRNLGIRTEAEVEKYARGHAVPVEIKKMLRLQFKIPLAILKQGVFSKMLMTIAYYRN